MNTVSSADDVYFEESEEERNEEVPLLQRLQPGPDNTHDGDSNSCNDDSDPNSNSEDEMPDDSNDDRYGGYDEYNEYVNMVNMIEAIIIMMEGTKEKPHQ